MLLYYLEFLELGTGICEASASSMLREGDWDHIRDMIKCLDIFLISRFKNLIFVYEGINFHFCSKYVRKGLIGRGGGKNVSFGGMAPLRYLIM